MCSLKRLAVILCLCKVCFCSAVSLNEEEYKQKVKDIIDQKWIELKIKDRITKRTKLGKYMLSRGFEENLVWNYLKEKK